VQRCIRVYTVCEFVSVGEEGDGHRQKSKVMQNCQVQVMHLHIDGFRPHARNLVPAHHHDLRAVRG